MLASTVNKSSGDWNSRHFKKSMGTFDSLLVADFNQDFGGFF